MSSGQTSLCGRARGALLLVAKLKMSRVGISDSDKKSEDVKRSRKECDWSCTRETVELTYVSRRATGSGHDVSSALHLREAKVADHDL